MSPRTVRSRLHETPVPSEPDRAARIGLVFVRQTSAPHVEPFFNEVMAGLDDGLTVAGRSLLARRVDDTADELAVYRQWHEQHAVDAVIVKDLVTDDPRPQLLQELGIPAVLMADVAQIDGHAIVHTDNAQTMRDAMDHLIRCGHRHIARVSGPEDLVHTRIRTETFVVEAAEAGVRAQVVTGDYSQESGRVLTREILTSTPRPSAIVFDNDLMAVGGLAAARELGISMPDELSLLAWDDSIYCQLTDPPLSALSHDVHEMGVQLSRVLMQLMDEGRPTAEAAIQPVLVQRGTTGNLVAASGLPENGESAVVG